MLRHLSGHEVATFSPFTYPCMLGAQKIVTVDKGASIIKVRPTEAVSSYIIATMLKCGPRVSGMSDSLDRMTSSHWLLCIK